MGADVAARRATSSSHGEVIDYKFDTRAIPVSWCARLRNGVLYRVAGEVGATEIAIGHYVDDFIETLLQGAEVSSRADRV